MDTDSVLPSQTCNLPITIIVLDLLTLLKFHFVWFKTKEQKMCIDVDPPDLRCRKSTILGTN